jgi:hypothetical protein
VPRREPYVGNGAQKRHDPPLIRILPGMRAAKVSHG